MLCAALAVTLYPPTAAEVFDACSRAHGRADSGSVSIEIVSTVAGPRQQSRFDLEYIRPDALKLRVVQPAQAGLDASDRTFAILGDRFVGYDARANERLDRRFARAGTLLERAIEALGGVEEPLPIFLDSGGASRFFAPFRDLRDWRRVERGGAIVLSRRSAAGLPKSASTFEFDKATRKLRYAMLEYAGGKLEWRFAHRAPPRRIAFVPPASATRVGSFTLRPALPRSVHRDAKPILERAVRAYARLRDVFVAVTDGGRTASIWWSQGRARQDGQGARWAYDGKTLTVDLPASRKFYRGAVKPGKVIGTLEKLQVDIDGTLVQLIQRISPVLGVMTHDAEVRVAGSIVLDKQTCDILEVRGRLTRASLVVRRSDGLLAQVGLERKDTGGKLAFRSDRTFKYASVGAPLGEALFRLAPKPGQAVSPLPK